MARTKYSIGAAWALGALLLLFAGNGLAGPSRANGTTANTATANCASAPVGLEIAALEDRDGTSVEDSPKPQNRPKPPERPKELGLNGNLAVVLSGTAPLDATCYVLFFNGHAIEDLSQTYFDARLHAIVFPLVRTSKNASQWVSILGSPTSLTKSVSVELGERAASGVPTAPSIAAPKGEHRTFSFVIFSVWRLLFAAAVVIAMVAFVWGRARRTTILKDNLIPQIDPVRQTFSLGRWQMAVWFSLVFASYVFLYILLGDVNTLPAQALILMGISGATALAAVEVDVLKDSPPDAVNQGLRLLGINSYADVVRIRVEIADRQTQLVGPPVPPPATAALLSSEILDRQLKLRTYEEAIAPYVSHGWMNDMSTDINGPALHRIQVVCWTLLLGVIFLVGVWTELAMPTFSETLLALMGVSGASYVGFKFPEKQQ